MSDIQFTITEYNPTDQSAQFGSAVFGEAVANEPTELVGSYFGASVNGRYTTTMGHGVFRSRGDLRPKFYYVKPKSSSQGVNFANIAIVSSTGALVGRLRTDVQKTIISNVEFTIVKGDCRDFVIELNDLPAFPLAPFSIVKINVGNSGFNWYMGKITNQENAGSKDGAKYRFTGSGLSETDLDSLVFDDSLDFDSAQDVGEIVDAIVQTQIAPFSFINYNPSKIDRTTGVFTANVIEPGKTKMSKFLDTMAKMAGCEWGVDGEGDFFFLPIEHALVRTFFVGYDLTNFKPKLNLQNVKNTIFVKRQQGKGSGGAGWAVQTIRSDLTSIAKYGKRELTFQAPGFFQDNDLNVIGDALLNDLKEPKYSATANGFRVTGELDFIKRGQHRFILPFDKYQHTWTEGELASEWTTSGSGITLSTNTTNFVFGASSVKGAFSTSSGSRIERVGSYSGKIQKVIIWIRSNTSGAFLTAGIGLSSWNQFSNVINIPQNDVFFAYEWDVSSFGITKIDRIGIQSNTNDAFELFVDKIEFVVKGFPSYRMQSTKQTYSFEPGGADVTMEFDRVPSKMEDYINNILAIAEENRFVGEVR